MVVGVLFTLIILGLIVLLSCVLFLCGCSYDWLGFIYLLACFVFFCLRCLFVFSGLE